MPKEKTAMKLESIRHSDGRFWLRKNGRIIYSEILHPEQEPHAGEVAGLVYRALGCKIVEAIELVQPLIERPTVRVTHPAYVQPYQESR